MRVCFLVVLFLCCGCGGPGRVSVPAEAPLPKKEVNPIFKKGDLVRFKITWERGVVLWVWSYPDRVEYRVRYRVVDNFRCDDFQEFELEGI